MDLKTNLSMHVLKEISNYHELKLNNQDKMKVFPTKSNHLSFDFLNEFNKNKHVMSKEMEKPIKQTETNKKIELIIPNDLIGCVIGRGGSKINEIRQVCLK